MKKSLSLFTALVLLATVLLSACSSGVAPGSSPGSTPAGSGAPADGGPSGEIVIATWGGKYNELLQEFVDAELQKTAPNLKVIYAPGQHTEYIAKAYTEKDSAAGTYDIMLLGSDNYIDLYNNDIIVELDESKIPNLEYVYDNMKSPFYIPHVYSALTLAYNEKQIATAPDSWDTLFDPQYKGKVGVMTGMVSFWMYAAVLADDGRVEDNDWMSHWDKIMSLRENDCKFYSSNDALDAALQSGEVWLSLGWRARNALLTVEGSEPIGNIVPTEGSISFIFGAAIMKNAKNPEGAYAYLNAMLAVQSQIGFCSGMGYAPVVNNAPLPQEIAEKIAFRDDEMPRIGKLDDAYVAALSEELDPKWNQEFVRE